MLLRQITAVSITCLLLTVPVHADLIVDLIDSQGHDSGWSVVLPDGGHSGIVVDRVCSDYVRIEVAKDLLCCEDGRFVPHTMLFRQRLNDAHTVPTIQIGDEIIRNLTGVDWTDYHWQLTGCAAAFDAAATDASGFSIDPFTHRTWGAAVWDDDHAVALDVDGGTVAAGETFTPGLLSGKLYIDVDLGADSTDFVLSQVPTPEPTAMAVIVAGGLWVVTRRRRTP